MIRPRLGPAALATCLILALAGAARGGVEIHSGLITGERFRRGPVALTADPFHKFDPMGGTRRLDRAIVRVGAQWECIVEIINPLPVYQAIQFNMLPTYADLDTNTDLEIDIHVFEQPSGIIGAGPFQTVQAPPFTAGGYGGVFDLRPQDPEFASFIGPGPITVERLSFGAAFDTFRVINGCPCHSPQGFGVYRERYEITVEFEYHYTLVPAPAAAVGLLMWLPIARRRRAPRPA